MSQTSIPPAASIQKPPLLTSMPIELAEDSTSPASGLLTSPIPFKAVPRPLVAASPIAGSDNGGMTMSPPQSTTGNTAQSSPESKKGKGRDVIGERVDELRGLLVGFAFALQ